MSLGHLCEISILLLEGRLSIDSDKEIALTNDSKGWIFYFLLGISVREKNKLPNSDSHILPYRP